MNESVCSKADYYYDIDKPVRLESEEVKSELINDTVVKCEATDDVEPVNSFTTFQYVNPEYIDNSVVKSETLDDAEKNAASVDRDYTRVQVKLEDSLINGSANVLNGQINTDTKLEFELPILQSILHPSYIDTEAYNNTSEETLNKDESLLDISRIKQEKSQSDSEEQNEIYARKYESTKVSKI